MATNMIVPVSDELATLLETTAAHLAMLDDPKTALSDRDHLPATLGHLSDLVGQVMMASVDASQSWTVPTGARFDLGALLNETVSQAIGLTREQAALGMDDLNQYAARRLGSARLSLSALHNSIVSGIHKRAMDDLQALRKGAPMGLIVAARTLSELDQAAD